MKVYYRLTENRDPEERLEEATLWKALHDEYGDDIELWSPSERGVPRDGLLFGRVGIFEEAKGAVLAVSKDLPYWQDPAFTRMAGRSCMFCTLDEAADEVQRLHGLGNDAFVKACFMKAVRVHVPVGKTLSEVLGIMALSFCDAPRCLLVQDWASMRYERRFVVIKRQIITHSPISAWLTPLDGQKYIHHHFASPLDAAPACRDEALTADFVERAEWIAANMLPDSAVIDMASINGDIGIVEFNPAQIGQFGLYGCDARAIAAASRMFSGGDPKLLTDHGRA